MTISMVGANGYYSECKALLLCELALALLFLVKYVLVQKKKEISVAVHYGKILSVTNRQNFVRSLELLGLTCGLRSSNESWVKMLSL